MTEYCNLLDIMHEGVIVLAPDDKNHQDYIRFCSRSAAKTLSISGKIEGCRSEAEIDAESYASSAVDMAANGKVLIVSPEDLKQNVFAEVNIATQNVDNNKDAKDDSQYNLL